MKAYSLLSILLICFTQTACDIKLPEQVQAGDVQLFPNYESVTIPVNIAPLNFRLPAADMEGITLLKSPNKELKEKE